MHDLHLLQDLLVLFGLGIFTVVIFHRFNLPPVLGFLLTGLVCGPFGFRLVDSTKEVETLAELGVVLLLFTIGIEFSFAKLKKLKRFLLIGGTLQVLLTIGSIALLANYFLLPWGVAVLLGMVASLSSTALVVRLLEHKGELSRSHGLTSLSMLVFQDLCIVPMVLVTPLLGSSGSSVSAMLWLTGKSLLFVVVAVVLARYLVPWLLNHVTKTRRREAFVLSVMLLCLGTGWATSQVGLSMALGAFLAGLIISESQYSHQALSDVLPFREVFNFLVFVSIGMLFDFRVLIEQPGAVAFSLFALLALKTGVIFLVTFALGHSIRVSLLSGFYLAQASEFSFVLAKLGLAEGVIDPKLNQLVCAVAILSMAVTPLLTTIASHLANWADRNLPASWTSRQRPLPTDEPKLTNHVVIIGFGLAGKMLAKALERTQIQYIAIDHDPAVVSNSRACGTPIFYGDAASQSVLEHAHIEGARMVVVTIPDPSNAIQTVATVRRLKEGIHIVALTRSIEQIAPLSKAGASHVIAEAAVGGVEVIRGVLRTSKVNEDDISDCIKFAYQTAAPGRDDSK